MSRLYIFKHLTITLQGDVLYEMKIFMHDNFSLTHH